MRGRGGTGTRTDVVDARHQHGEIVRIAPVERQVENALARDDLAGGGVVGLERGRGGLHRPLLGIVPDGEREIDRMRLRDIHRYPIGLFRRKAGSLYFH